MRRVENQSARCRRAVFHHCPLAAGTLAFTRPRIDSLPLSSQRFVRFDGPDRCWLVGVLTTGGPRAAKGAARGRAGLTRRVLLSGGRRSRVLRKTPGSVTRQLPIARVLSEWRAGTSRGMGVGRRPRGFWHYRHYCEDRHDGQFRVALDGPTSAACLATCGLWQEPSRWRGFSPWSS